MRRSFIMFILLILVINTVMADVDLTSDLICPCECVIAISTCDCVTAIYVKKEITQMKEIGFSENQILSVLYVEYGKEIMVYPEKGISSLWFIGAVLSILFVFLGYIFSKKKKVDVMPDIKRYEQQFEEEYGNFVSEIDEPNRNTNHISNDNKILDDKL